MAPIVPTRGCEGFGSVKSVRILQVGCQPVNIAADSDDSGTARKIFDEVKWKKLSIRNSERKTFDKESCTQ